ncbi:unnamed protein product [Leuciscus chuanchicus]
MKIALIHALFLLFEICVFGDADITETVSVIEGDSATLHTNVTEIQSSDEIEWRLNGNRIAIISGGSIKTEGSYRDGLKLDKQTGDLKITNIRSTDSGEYKLKVRNTRGSSEKTFSVSGVSGVDEVKSVSVIVGDSVTLNSRTIIQTDDVIEWRFLNSPIAEHNRKTGNFSTSDGPDERFRHRLQLDPQTGSLTITKIGPKHSGFYEAGFRKSSRTHTIHKSYNVTVSGEMKSALSVKEGDSVTLQTGLTEIQRDDLMLWRFGDTVIAEIYKAQKRFSIYDDVERFRDRLDLNKKTGSLTITDTRTEDAGLYELQINIIRFTINKRISVTVSDPGLSPGAVLGIVVVLLAFAAAAAAGVIYYRHRISELKALIDTLRVFEGKSFTLNPDEVLQDDKLQWMFRGACIAARESAALGFTVHDGVLDGIFKGRLKLDPQTGSLTIPNTSTTHSGLYELQIIRSGKISVKRFFVSVFVNIPEENEPLKGDP